MAEPRIIAVVPAFNSSAVVADAVISLLRQTVPPEEVIVVDDGSTDDTANVAERAGAHVIRRINGGPAAARNTGIAATDADWIALLDADDIALPNRLEVERQHLDDPKLAVVFGGHIVPGQTTRPRPERPTFASLWQQNEIVTSTVMLRRTAWAAAGCFDESRELIGVEDYNLWLRLAHLGWEFRGLPSDLIEYRRAAGCLSRQTRRFAAAELANVRQIGDRLALPGDVVTDKEFQVYLAYGLELFFFRDLPGARELLSEASRRGPLPLGARLRLLATRLPLRPRAGM